MENNLGIEIVSGEMPEYDIDNGMHEASLKEILDATRKKYQSEETEPVFKFVWIVSDNKGEEIELVRTVTKKISWEKQKSNLYKDLKALLPKAVQEEFESAGLVADMIIKLREGAKTGKVKAYLQLEKNDKGFTNITAVMPIPAVKKASKQVTIDEDEINL